MQAKNFTLVNETLPATLTNHPIYKAVLEHNKDALIDALHFDTPAEISLAADYYGYPADVAEWLGSINLFDDYSRFRLLAGYTKPQDEEAPATIMIEKRAIQLMLNIKPAFTPKNLWHKPFVTA